MSEAISDPVLQTMELHHVSKHTMGGHVVLHFYSTAAAERVRKASSVEFGSNCDTVVVITPLAPAGATAIPPNETWRYAVVSTKLPSYEYCKPAMLHQAFRALGKKALEIGRKLARSNLLQNEPEELQLYLYNCSGEVVNFHDISMEEIYEVHFTASGDSLAELDQAGIRHRAESWAGYSPTLKPEVITSCLWAYASSSKDPNIRVGGEPMYYSPHGSSIAGRLIHQSARGGRTAGRVGNPSRMGNPGRLGSLGRTGNAGRGPGRAAPTPPQPIQLYKASANTAVIAAIVMSRETTFHPGEVLNLNRQPHKEVNTAAVMAMSGLGPQALPTAVVKEVTVESPDAIDDVLAGLTGNSATPPGVAVPNAPVGVYLGLQMKAWLAS
ncbi:TPA: hypothetical protein ACH3X1_013326 [Trebouxia sp. C0004]